MALATDKIQGTVSMTLAIDNMQGTVSMTLAIDKIQGTVSMTLAIDNMQESVALATDNMPQQGFMTIFDKPWPVGKIWLVDNFHIILILF